MKSPLTPARSLTIAAACLAAFPALAPADAANDPPPADVFVGEYAFSPADVTIQSGATVTWHWVGPDTDHSVTTDSGQDESFDSHKGRPVTGAPKGGSYVHTFTHTGTFTYFCSRHPSMRAQVTVVDASSQPPRNPADYVPPAAAGSGDPDSSTDAAAGPAQRDGATPAADSSGPSAPPAAAAAPAAAPDTARVRGLRAHARSGSLSINVSTSGAAQLDVVVQGRRRGDAWAPVLRAVRRTRGGAAVLHLELPRRARGLTRLRVSIRAVGDDGVASAARTVELRQR